MTVRIPYEYRPGIGFGILSITYLLVSLFLIWGASTPPLDTVWRVYHELRSSKVSRLSSSELSTLNQSLNRHKSLAKILLNGQNIGLMSANTNGWLETPVAYVLRTAECKNNCQIKLDCQTPEDLLPVTMILKSANFQLEFALTKQGLTPIELPSSKVDSSELIEVHIQMSSNNRKEEVSDQTLGLRFIFEEI